MLSSLKGISYVCRRGFSSLSGSKRVALMVMRLVAVISKPFFRAVHAGALVHRVLHVLADFGDALVAALLVEEAALNALCLILQHRFDRVGASSGQRADLLGGRAARRRSEHQAFGQRVR